MPGRGEVWQRNLPVPKAESKVRGSNPTNTLRQDSRSMAPEGAGVWREDICRKRSSRGSELPCNRSLKITPRYHPAVLNHQNNAWATH